MTQGRRQLTYSPGFTPSDSPLLMPPPALASFDALGLRVDIRLGVPAVAEVSGDVDIATAPWLRETLLLAIQRHGPAISVDLQGVTFLDCAGINALLAAVRKARLEGGQVQVTRSSARAWRVITLLGLQDLFTGAGNPDVLLAPSNRWIWGWPGLGTRQPRTLASRRYGAGRGRRYRGRVIRLHA